MSSTHLPTTAASPATPPARHAIDVNHEAALGTPWATEHMKKINRIAIAIIGTSMVIASAALVLSLSSSPIIPIALLMISLVMVGIMMYKLDFQYIHVIDQEKAPLLAQTAANPIRATPSIPHQSAPAARAPHHPLPAPSVSPTGPSSTFIPINHINETDGLDMIEIEDDARTPTTHPSPTITPTSSPLPNSAPSSLMPINLSFAPCSTDGTNNASSSVQMQPVNHSFSRNPSPAPRKQSIARSVKIGQSLNHRQNIPQQDRTPPPMNSSPEFNSILNHEARYSNNNSPRSSPSGFNPEAALAAEHFYAAGGLGSIGYNIDVNADNDGL